MSIELPLYQQEKNNTCALACLRMVLAGFGVQIDESTIESKAMLEADGTAIDELHRLAALHNLVAEVRETTVEDFRRILAEGRLPIAYIDRAVFDLTPQQRAMHFLRDAKIHCVVPTRITDAFVSFHDPLPPRITRRSIEVFRQAHEKLGSYSVVCSKPESQ